MKTSLYNFYKNHYDLKKFNKNISDKKLLLLIYDDKYYYYLEKDKFIEYDIEDSMLNIVNIISKKFKIDVINYYPICLCNKTIIIGLRIKNDISSSLNRLSVEDIPDKYKEIVEYHRNSFEMFYFSSTVMEEIKMSRRNKLRYKIHEKIIKKYILTSKKRKKEEFNKLLEDNIFEYKTAIDVSCGDSKDLFKVAKKKKYNEIVGNDICVNYLYKNNYNDVIYTNDDIEYNLVKKNSFDLVFCKNTLHHMKNLININNLLKCLDNISKNEILIVEIINPKETGGLSAFLNKWLYVKFLKDVGDCFLNKKQFIKLIENNYKDYDIKFEEFENILGKYMIARIKKGK